MAGLREKFFVLLGAAMALAQCAVVGEVRATGFIPPRNRIHIERQDTPKQTKALLGARFSSASLPSKWDSRDEYWVTSVKDQGNVNSCWAFSACAVLET